MAFKIARFEDALRTTHEDAGTLQDFLDEENNYSVIPFKEKQNPTGWAVPFVTGHKYRAHWA